MSKITITAILIALVGFVSCLECPPESLTRPCTCFRAGGLFLVCDKITSKDDLEGVFRRIGNTRIASFELKYSSVQSIPSSSIARNRFISLTVFKSNLTSLFDTNPSVANSLQIISLQSVKFQGSWEEFKNLGQLRTFSCEEVDLPILGSGFKNNINKGLTHLILQRTRTSYLLDEVFSQHKSLVYVRIQNSYLRTLKRNDFPRPAKIQDLDFDGNQIQSLPDDMFEAMPKLRTVSFAGNKLSVVSETVFGGVFDQLSLLNLAFNPINCDCKIRWITSRRIGHNLYAECAEPANLKDELLIDLKSKDLGPCE